MDTTSAMRVLLTGGTGFIGRHCLRPLLALGYEVHASRFTGPSDPPGTACQWHVADLRDAEQASALVARVRPSHLLHLAWCAEPGTYWTSPDNLRWVQGSLGLLRSFADHGGERVVMAGTCAEYDWATGTCHEADTPLRPATLYGASKHALESILRTHAAVSGLGQAWGRIFSVYGPHEHPSRFVASIAGSLLRAEPTRCSSGIQQRDLLHAADVADAFVSLLDSSVEGAVNIGAGATVALADVARILGRLADRPELVQLGALPDRPNDPPVLAADTGRLRHELRWKPRFDLETGLASTFEWWKAHRE